MWILHSTEPKIQWKALSTGDHSTEMSMTLQYHPHCMLFVCYTLGLSLTWSSEFHRSLGIKLRIRDMHKHIKCIKKKKSLSLLLGDVLNIVWHCFSVGNSRLLPFLFLLHLLSCISSHGFIYLLWSLFIRSSCSEIAGKLKEIANFFQLQKWDLDALSLKFQISWGTVAQDVQ